MSEAVDARPALRPDAFVHPNSPRKQNQLLSNELISGPADYVRAVYQIKVPARFSFEELLQPEVWKNIEDVVVVISESGQFDCDLRVISSDRGYSLMRPLRTWFAPDVEHQVAGEPRVAFSPGIGFVAYSADGSPISKHLTSDAAEAALREYLKGTTDVQAT